MVNLNTAISVLFTTQNSMPTVHYHETIVNRTLMKLLLLIEDVEGELEGLIPNLCYWKITGLGLWHV